MSYDPTMQIPQNVMDAALLIERHFKEQGIDSWELCGICSRDRLTKAEAALFRIQRIVKEFDSSSLQA